MMCASSPSTNPSSCDSAAADPPPPCRDLVRPSTSGHTTTESCPDAATSPASSSPAVARSVPPHQEPHYPESTAHVVYFTTELANQAALEYEKEKFDSLVEWHRRYHERVDREKSSAVPSPSTTVSQQSTDAAKLAGESKPLKRKAETDPEIITCDAKKPLLESIPEESGDKPVYLDIGSAQKKDDFNPLRRMEMMTNSSAFSASSSITEVVVEPKKDDRSAKLDKLGGIEKDVNAEQQARNFHQHQMWQQQQHMERVRLHQQQQMESGGAPGPMGPMGGPYPPNFPPNGHPGQMPPNPLSAGAYPSPHFPGMPPFPFPHMQGPPARATSRGAKSKPSPGAFPPGFKPGMMSPQQQQHMAHMMHMQHMAAAARGMVPQPGRSPSFPGFPHPGMHPSPHPGMPPYPSPMYPYPGGAMMGGPPGGPMGGPPGGPMPGPPGGPMTDPMRGPMSGPMPSYMGGGPMPSPMTGPQSCGPVPGSTNGGPMSGPMPQGMGDPAGPNGHMAAPNSAPGMNKPMMSPYPGPPGAGMMPVSAPFPNASCMPGGMLMVSRGSAPPSSVYGGGGQEATTWPAQFCDANSLPGFSQPYPTASLAPTSSCQTTTISL